MIEAVHTLSSGKITSEITNFHVEGFKRIEEEITAECFPEFNRIFKNTQRLKPSEFNIKTVVHFSGF